MEYECPDPWPNERFCPKGLRVNAAFCFLGHIVLNVTILGELDWLVFYNPPGYAGWHFASPWASNDFHQFKEYLVLMFNDPQYGEAWIHNYFAGHGELARTDVNTRSVRARFGV